MGGREGEREVGKEKEGSRNRGREPGKEGDFYHTSLVYLIH